MDAWHFQTIRALVCWKLKKIIILNSYMYNHKHDTTTGFTGVDNTGYYTVT